jgi:RHS repeat-associated protein
LGQVTRLAHPNGTVTSLTYDQANRLTGLDNRQMLAAQPQSAYAYALDKAGNRTQVIETRAAFDGSSTPVVLTHDYEYDALNRLTQATTDTPNSDTTYTFDAIGNRLDKSGTVLAPDPGTPELPVTPRLEAVSSTYNAANQLTEVIDQSAVTSLEYDRNGNRLRETEVDSKGKTLLTEYRYDYENRLIGVTKSKNNKLTMQATYTYDGYGRRVQKEVHNSQFTIHHSQLLTYLYDELDIIGAILEQDGSSKETYYYLAPSPLTSLRRPLAMEQLDKGKRYWYQTDGLDSIVALTDENGTLVSPFLYDEYGQILAGETDLQLFTYTAQDYDPETGLVHFYARYYDPARGVWLGQDPYRGRLGEPGTLQRYGYVGGNPVSSVDVYGFDRNPQRVSSDDTEFIISLIQQYSDSDILDLIIALAPWGIIDTKFRKHIQDLLGEDTKLEVGDYSMDASGLANIMFGFYMEALGISERIEDQVADIDQDIRCIGVTNPGPNECISGRDNEDDIIQRRIGRRLAELSREKNKIENRRDEVDPNNVDADMVKKAVKDVSSNREKILEEYQSWGDYKEGVENYLRDKGPYFYYRYINSSLYLP